MANKSLTIKFRGEEKTLKITFGALRAFEQKTGKNIIKGGFSLETVEDLATLLWACLLRYDPKLTLEEIMDEYGIDELGVMQQAWNNSAAEGDKSGAPLAVEPGSPSPG